MNTTRTARGLYTNHSLATARPLLVMATNTLPATPFVGSAAERLLSDNEV